MSKPAGAPPESPAASPAEASPAGGPGRAKRRRKVVGFAVGVVLLLGAAWVLYAHAGAVEGAWASARSAPWWLASLALLLPLCNWLLISLSFWTMMRRHGRIGYVEMSEAIGGAWLLNYLPLRAGMVGRVAYHRAVNRISVADSLRVMVFNMALGAVAVLAVLGIAAAMGRTATGAQWGLALMGPLLGIAGSRVVLARRGKAFVADVLLIRYLDMMVWVARYAVVFAIVGAPISLPGAVAVAAACQAALIVPFIGNGLGLREWAVGLTAAALPAGALSVSGELTTATGLLADVVNRAAELAVAVPLGQWCLWRLGGRMRGVRA